MMLGGEGAGGFIEPHVGDAAGAVEGDPGEVAEERIARLQDFEVSEAFVFENARADEQVEDPG